MALDAHRSGMPAGVVAPPGPLGLYRSWRAARRNLLELIPIQAYREPVIAGGRGAGWIMLSDPVAVEHVLRSRAEAYPRAPIARRILKPREGDSVLTANGAEHRFLRRAMAPMFQRRALSSLVPVMAAAGEAAAARIAADAGQGPVDVHPEMTAATCDVIADAALSGREALDRDAITDGVTRFIAGKARLSILDLLGAPSWVPRPGELIHGNSRAMDAMMDAIVAARKARGPSDPPDMLDLLQAAEDPETGRRLDRVELRNNLLAFIVAGHETTALALTWALYLMAFDRDVQRRARDEVDSVLGDRVPGAEDLDRLSLLRRIVEEAMRLYPPAGLISRMSLEEDEIAGHAVRPGTIAILPIYAMQRHERLWENPGMFDPDRFLPERSGGRHRSAFLPFGGGPRVCIGLQLALMEAQTILAVLLRRLSFELPEGASPRLQMWFTLRPETGMPLLASRV